METVLITGGTGLIGKELTNLLIEKKYRVIILTRKIPAKAAAIKGIQYATWNVEKQTIDKEAIEQADYVIHLAGANVAEKRWTQKRKLEIVNSRVESGKLLSNAIATVPNKIKAVISSSAIGWYGPDTEKSLQDGFVEKDAAVTHFLGKTCELWESAIQPVTEKGIRLVTIRTGIVLSKQGGALAAFMQPLKMGVAAIMGSGNQYISWIHISDICGMFLYALQNSTLHGAFNGVASQPVTNKQFTLSLAKIMRGNWFIPIHIPAFFLSAILGEMSVEVLKSAKVSNQKVKLAGYHFKFPTLELALQQLIKS